MDRVRRSLPREEVRYVSQDDVGTIGLRQHLMLSLGDVLMLGEGVYQKQRVVKVNFADQLPENLSLPLSDSR